MDFFNMENFKDKKVRLETTEGTYEGLVQSVELKSKFLSIYNAVFLENNMHIQGVLTFSSYDIIKCEFLETIDSGKEEKRFDDPLLFKKTRPKHLNSLETFNYGTLLTHGLHPLTDPRDFLNGVTKNEPLNKIDEFNSQELNNLQEKKNLDDRNLCKDRANVLYCKPSSYTLVDKLNDNFSNSVEHIKKQKVIGLAMEGVRLCRNGELCWIQIATDINTFLFDVYVLGEDAMNNGLKEILEDENILKVIHDCRNISDIMYHQYHIELHNIFDTQVSDALVYKMRHNDCFPRYVRGLSNCLLDYLKLTPLQIHFQRMRQNSMQKDQAVWKVRPLPDSLLDALAKHVIYLRDLRIALLNELMAELRNGTEIYLSVIRDSDSDDIDQRVNNGHLLPSIFMEINESRSRRFYRRRPFNKFKDNFVPVRDPFIQPSRDIWHYKNDTDKDKDLQKSSPSLSPPKTEKLTTTSNELEPGTCHQNQKKEIHPLSENKSDAEVQNKKTSEDINILPSVNHFSENNIETHSSNECNKRVPSLDKLKDLLKFLENHQQPEKIIRESHTGISVENGKTDTLLKTERNCNSLNLPPVSDMDENNRNLTNLQMPFNKTYKPVYVPT